jgi:hypothetical protein
MVEAEDGLRWAYGRRSSSAAVFLDHARTILDRASRASASWDYAPPPPDGRHCLQMGLFDLDPAEQVLLAHGIQQGRMVGRHMPADQPNDLVIAIASGHEPTFASDQLRHWTSLPFDAQRIATMLV